MCDILFLTTDTRFIPSDHMGIPFAITVYRVDEYGFFHCNISRGVRLSADTNASIEVPSELLADTFNFFIGM